MIPVPHCEVIGREPVQIRFPEISLLLDVIEIAEVVPNHNVNPAGRHRNIGDVKGEHLLDPPGGDADGLQRLAAQGIGEPLDDHIVILAVIGSVFRFHVDPRRHPSFEADADNASAASPVSTKKGTTSAPVASS